jgi:hypothetical protein
MPRQKKDAKILNIKLAKEISDQLEQFCEESGISKTVATEKILSKYFEEYFSRPHTFQIRIFKGAINLDGVR